MDFRGFIDTSFVDWDGRVSAVAFTGGCNLRCVYCYNFGLVLHPEKFDMVPADYILKYLEENNDFIDGLVITGGEPTLQPDLAGFCQIVKALGIAIKLDTNGTNPQSLQKLIDKGLVDYIAMDVKAPFDKGKYSKIAATKLNGLFKDITTTAELIISSGIDHEFRTTVVPTHHTSEDIESIAFSLSGAKRYYLQKFQPHTRFDELNTHPPQTDEEMEELTKTARKHIPTAEWRGK